MCKLSLCLVPDLWVGCLDLGIYHLQIWEKINLTLTIQPHRKILFLGILFLILKFFGIVARKIFSLVPKLKIFLTLYQAKLL